MEEVGKSGAAELRTQSHETSGFLFASTAFARWTTNSRKNKQTISYTATSPNGVVRIRREYCHVSAGSSRARAPPNVSNSLK
jgi:hypothetical protein